MKKILLTVLLSFMYSVVDAQFNVLDARLKILEEREGINESLKNENIDNKRFIFVKDFEDHTERYFISINGTKATFIEIFDDKSNGESSSNVFSGDVVRTNKNVLSFRFNTLEGEKIAVPITKTLLLTKKRKYIYLVDVNNKERWIDEYWIKNKK